MSTPYRFQPKNSSDRQLNTQPFQVGKRETSYEGRDDSKVGANHSSFPSAFGGRERRERVSNTNPNEYSKWKTSEEKAKPLTADDFPPLGSGTTRANPIISTGPSLAERLKVTIAKEEEEASIRRFIKEEEVHNESYEAPTALSIGKLYQQRMQKRRDEEARREAEREADEANYQWQVSREIVQESEEDYPPYASVTDDEYEDTSCFPADDEDGEIHPRTPHYH